MIGGMKRLTRARRSFRTASSSLRVSAKIRSKVSNMSVSSVQSLAGDRAASNSEKYDHRNQHQHVGDDDAPDIARQEYRLEQSDVVARGQDVGDRADGRRHAAQVEQ